MCQVTGLVPGLNIFILSRQVRSITIYLFEMEVVKYFELLMLPIYKYTCSVGKSMLSPCMYLYINNGSGQNNDFKGNLENVSINKIYTNDCP
jgi:hypothetical protein